MRAAIYATAAEAQDAIDAIDKARGPTETVRLPDGTLETRPTKTWARPVQLRDGRFAVPLEERVEALGGRTERVEDRDVTIPRLRDAVVVRDGDREDTREARGELAGREPSR